MSKFTDDLARLDLLGWIRGIVAGFISGAAGSFTSMIPISAMAPEHFSAGSPQYFKAMLWMALIQGITGMALYLKQHSVPDYVETSTRQTTTVLPTNPPTKVVETVQTVTTGEQPKP